MSREAELLRDIKRLAETPVESQHWVWLTAPLTSTSWDSDSYSTVGKTLIDLSAVFSAPANIKALLVQVAVRDSASSGGDYYIMLSPNNTAGSGIVADCGGNANDVYRRNTFIVPCDANGDVYYQTTASGAGTLDVVIQIWGYQI